MKKVVIVGTGSRCQGMFAKPIFEEMNGSVKICGLYDKNIKRAQVISKTCGNPTVYDDFDKMVDEVNPDYVIVTTIDCTHHEYIIRSLDKGYDVIVEKPMTIDIDKCRAIIEAEKRTGKSVTVTFNCRFMPFYSEIKKLLDENVIGEVLNIDFQYLLDTRHGADYFRRWHSRIENSGSLLVHKSTHHFDIINWFLNDTPSKVSAFGTRRFYGNTRAEKGERCLTCAYKNSCEFYFNIEQSKVDRELYLNTESVDGYIRDACVFSDDINIYDTMSVNVKYKKGTALLYSLVAYSPYEGWKMCITGSKGRLEAAEYYTGCKVDNMFNEIDIFDLYGNVRNHKIRKNLSAHGGGDIKLRQMLFDKNMPDDMERMANSYDGAASLLIGACSNISIKENRIVDIEEVLKDLNLK